VSLPAGWTTATIGEITIPRVEQGEPGPVEVSYIDIGCIDRNSKRVGETARINGKNAPTRARQWVRTGDVLVSMTRPNLNAVAQVPAEHEGSVASTGFDVLRAVGVLPSWIFNRVRTDAFVADMCKDVQGVVYPAIRPNDVRSHQLPIPPLPEQHRIVEAIESYLSRLDAAVGCLESAQAKLKAYRASVLKAAVEGRLVPTETELARREGRDCEPAQVLLERILKERRRRWEEAELAKLKASGRTPRDDRWKARYREPEAPDTSSLPELPEGWCWASLDQLLEEPLSNGKSVPDGDGFPVLRLTSIRGGVVDTTERKSGSWGRLDPVAFTVKPGDFLIVRGNGSVRLVGRGAVVGDPVEPVAFPDTLIRARVSRSGVLPGFLPYLWDSQPVRSFIERKAKTTAGIYKINPADLANVPLPLAPLAEQARLAEEIDRLQSLNTSILGIAQRAQSKADRARQAILKWAFEGKLVDQDPSDEPAEKLLERIRASNAEPTPGKKTRGRKTRAV
jgi:type I restriction enzyme S subunit